MFSVSLFTIVDSKTKKFLPTIEKELDIPIYTVPFKGFGLVKKLYVSLAKRVMPYMEEYKESGINNVLLKKINEEHPDIIQQLRLPDLMFFFFLFLLIITIILYILDKLVLLPLLIIYLFVVSFTHVIHKFYIKGYKLISFILAGFVNSIFIMFYFLGRIVGFLYK